MNTNVAIIADSFGNSMDNYIKVFFFSPSN